jgi:hypothetical protein
MPIDNNTAELLAPQLAGVLYRSGLEPIMTQLCQHPDAISAFEADWSMLTEEQQRDLLRIAVKEAATLPELAATFRKLTRQRSGIIEAATRFVELLPLFVFLAGVRTKADIKLGKFGNLKFEYHGDMKHLTDLIRLLLSKPPDSE